MDPDIKLYHDKIEKDKNVQESEITKFIGFPRDPKFPNRVDDKKSSLITYDQNLKPEYELIIPADIEVNKFK